MAFVKRWAIRTGPAQPGDVALTRGGSAFAHLTEEAGGVSGFWATPSLQSDYAFASIAGDALTGIGLFPDGTITAWTADGTDETNVQWSMQRTSDANPLLYFDGNGGVHWGDGTNPPDTTVKRDPGGAGVIVGDSLGVSQSDDYSGPYVFLAANDGSIFLTNGTGSCTLTTDNSGNLLVNGDVVATV